MDKRLLDEGDGLVAPAEGPDPEEKGARGLDLDPDKHDNECELEEGADQVGQGLEVSEEVQWSSRCH